jgi:hypothetical protein
LAASSTPRAGFEKGFVVEETLLKLALISALAATALSPAIASAEPPPESSARAAAKDAGDDDDFEKKGPVDRKVHISGVGAISGRLTYYDDHNLADGTRREDERTMQIDHIHLKFAGDLTDSLSWSVMPCLIHMNEFSVIEAKFTYSFHSAFQVTVGRFLLPFGQFNLRALPGLFNTISRPLLFQSHDDRFISFPGTPQPFLFTPRDDLGVLVGGSVWLGSAEKWQLSYQLYFTNGLRAVSDTSARFWDDNNNGKQFGGRMTLGYYGDKVSLALGGSALFNEYEDTHRQVAFGGDAVLSYEVARGRRINLRGEYVFMRREVLPGPQLLSGDEEISGFYISIDGMLNAWMGAFAQFDSLRNSHPQAFLNESFGDSEVTMNRWLVGLLFQPVGPLFIRLEYSRWMMPLGYPDAHRVDIQTLWTF